MGLYVREYVFYVCLCVGVCMCVCVYTCAKPEHNEERRMFCQFIVWCVFVSVGRKQPHNPRSHIDDPPHVPKAADKDLAEFLRRLQAKDKTLRTIK